MAAIRTTPLVLVLSSALASGCQGQLSAEPPIHPQRNMFNQDRYDHQEKNEFYADKRALRPLPQGVVANGALKEDSASFAGSNLPRLQRSPTARSLRHLRLPALFM